MGRLKGSLRIDVGIEKIKEYLMSKIDTTNPVEVEKVGRYLKHIEIYRRMERTVKKEGVSITVENANQFFVKAHPLLTEMNKVNSSIMNIERTFNFIDDDGEPKFTANDLI
ncbi:P27 family phage terminase small subunit [Sutcliffiella cohnii]